MEKQNKEGKEFYEACMILAAVGDAMGYKNGSWQFNTSSNLIHKQMMELTNNKGPLALKISMDWKYSDDTVMHIATAKALTQSKIIQSVDTISKRIALQYKKCAKYMAGRAPGKTCMKTLSIIDQTASNWNKIPYSQLKGGGCGASMRSACIGLFFHKQENLTKLIGLSIESGRITHHNPIGYLGSLISSYFTHLAIQKIQPREWLAYLFQKGLPMAKQHIEAYGRQVKVNLQGGQWQKAQQSLIQYAKSRSLSTKIGQLADPVFPTNYGIIQREHFYKTISINKWPGSVGIDSVIIAYDALLGCSGSWQEYCLRGILHGGDNDSTGTIGGAWFGAYYGFKSVPKNHYQQLEDNKKLRFLGQKIYIITH